MLILQLNRDIIHNSISDESTVSNTEILCTIFVKPYSIIQKFEKNLWSFFQTFKNLIFTSEDDLFRV